MLTARKLLGRLKKNKVLLQANKCNVRKLQKMSDWKDGFVEDFEYPKVQSTSHYGNTVNVSVETSGFHSGSYSLSQQRYEPTLSDVRKWEYNGYEDTGSTSDSHLKFSVVCYNVLAQEYIVGIPELYRECDKRDLQWSVRWERLKKDFEATDGDIVCLQEVQVEHYNTFYQPAFTQLGYSGCFKQKTGGKVDGCAIFFRASMFALKEQHSVECYKRGVNLLDRDNIGLIVTLAPLSDPTKELCVATTHLLFNPKREDVRLAQLQVLLSEIDHIAYRTDHYLPVIFCGDLNLNPSSSLYTFLRDGRLRYEHLEHRRLSYSGSKKVGKIFLPQSLQITDSSQRLQSLYSRNEDSCAVFASGTLSHVLNLKSVYDNRSFPNVPPNSMVSTFQNGWTLVDYIFYSDNGKDCNFSKELTLLGRMRLPSDEDCKSFGPLPNQYNGSDHYLLQALFSWNIK